MATATMPQTPGRRLVSRRTSEILTAYSFVLPYLLITLVFTVGVIIFAFGVSFTNFGLFITPQTWPPQFIGLGNYLQAFQTKVFLQALVNVFWYVIIVMPVQTALAIILAVLLNAPMRAKQFFRTVFYAPSVTSSVVITMIFWWIYLKSGYLNYFLSSGLGALGIHFIRDDFLADPRGLFQLVALAFHSNISSEFWYLRGPSVAWMAIMFQNIFTTAPTFMVMFLAALQDIPPSLYEAASIDGANGWQRFWKITLPMLRPIILLVVVLGTIGTFQIFDQVKIMTAGEPLGTTMVPVYLIYRDALGQSGPPQMGWASALAFILFALIFIFTFIQRRYIESGTEQY